VVASQVCNLHRGRWLGIAGCGREEGKHGAMDRSPLFIFVVTGRE